VQGSSSWTRVSFGTGSATPTPAGTQWILYDKDPVLQDSTTYVYVATNAFYTATNTLSAASPPWIGTTSDCSGKTPPPPITGTGNSVN
jgi:hypothetical protein